MRRTGSTSRSVTLAEARPRAPVQVGFQAGTDSWDSVSAPGCWVVLSNTVRSTEPGSGWQPTCRRRWRRRRDPSGGRRRPGAGPLRVRRAPGLEPRHRGRRRGGRRRGSLGAVSTYHPRRGPDGRSHAPDGRPGGNATDHGRPAMHRHARTRPDDVRRGRARPPRPSGPAPAGSCSRTPGRPSCSTPSQWWPPETPCSRRRSRDV